MRSRGDGVREEEREGRAHGVKQEEQGKPENRECRRIGVEKTDDAREDDREKAWGQVGDPGGRQQQCPRGQSPKE